MYAPIQTFVPLASLSVLPSTDPNYPFPPFYDSGNFLWNTPYFITPTALLAFLLIAGLGRYLIVVRDSATTTTTSSDPRDAHRSLETPLSNASTLLPSGHARRNSRLLSHDPPLDKFVYALGFIIAATFIADAVVVCARALAVKQWTSIALAYYDAASWLAWTINFVLLVTEKRKFGKWSWVQYTFWWGSGVGESMIAWMWVNGIMHPRDGTIFSNWDYALFAIFSLRYLSLFTLLIATLVRLSHPTPVPLLPTTPSSSYGTFSHAASDPLASGAEEDTDDNHSAFAGFVDKMRRLLPFMWPKNDRWLQFLVVLCFLLLVIGRVINVLTPLQLGILIDELDGTNGNPPRFCWDQILIYVFLRFLQGGVGLIQSTQNYLWIPLGQYTTREISVRMFEHLHNLSLQFHINRKTGEVLRVMDRGTNSIIQLLSQILFQIFPTLIDILLAVVYFIIVFGWGFGAIVLATMVLYIYITIAITEWRTSFRREMIELDNDARAKAVDSLLNFETVKYYNAEDFEVQRYAQAIERYQVADFKSSSSLNVLNLSQNAVITGGLLAGCLLCAYDVVNGRLSKGAFVVFLTYILQLYQPLNFFGTYYRMIQSNFVDMEKMLALFKYDQSVKDAPDATELIVSQGTVEFDNVSFAYDSRIPALRNISFTIPKGATVALVGPSGGGKSTILRLLFRFYDVQSGRILVDGQDIRSVTQHSLRRSIGVVPQDTVLFNDTILYNIRYGDVRASDEMVIKAAKAAQIHERILSFPDGYDTRVGERGLRLSGGEKQRVAIARTILKNPPIILLDEATSALDTTTERQIQYALAEMTQDRTTLVVAHRLSTIVDADLILCVQDGQIVEAGTHQELMRMALENGGDGVYYEMWQKQMYEESKKPANISSPADPVILPPIAEVDIEAEAEDAQDEKPHAGDDEEDDEDVDDDILAGSATFTEPLTDPALSTRGADSPVSEESTGSLSSSGLRLPLAPEEEGEEGTDG